VGPLLTLQVHERMRTALQAGASALTCSLDLDRSQTEVRLNGTGWDYAGGRFPWLEQCKDRTIYYWTGAAFQPASRFTTSLIKLVPTEWGPPTFEIDGIKMLPTAKISPYADAERKVGWVHPRGKVVAVGWATSPLGACRERRRRSSRMRKIPTCSGCGVSTPGRPSPVAP
jgi:uncharacterized protein